jgi:hypothetical protein
LGLQPEIRELNSLINLWYLDDGNLMGEPEVVLEDFKRVLLFGEKLELQINQRKCELVVIDQGDPDTGLQGKHYRTVPGSCPRHSFEAG